MPSSEDLPWTKGQIAIMRRRLLEWYDVSHRKLPWRETTNPYHIWVSEIMLQQTRVNVVIPYYERFLQRFPTIETLAEAPEAELLAAWAGLGYYSRVRNMQRAAGEMRAGFPSTYEAIRELAGIGDYTAAAIASMAFQLPYAAVDGNVIRVVSRLANKSLDISKALNRKRLQLLADSLLERSHPGKFNQAVMELGAVVCLPRQPDCKRCPIRDSCLARQAGTAESLPAKSGKPETVRIVASLLAVIRGERILLRRRRQPARIAGFWELPEPEHVANVAIGDVLGSFKHSITHHRYTFEVVRAKLSAMNADRNVNAEFRWVPMGELDQLPLSTVARKALRLIPKRMAARRS